MDFQIMQQKHYWGLSEEGFHRIAYTEWAEAGPDQLTCICAHGLTRNSRDFDPLAAYLSKQRYHVFCPDIVGRGDSDWLKDYLHYTYEQYVADMAAMIARTNANSVAWIGTSMGGLIGMILAALPQSPVHYLILNDIGAQIPTAALARLASYVGQDPTFSSLQEATSYFKTIYNTFGTLTETEWQYLTQNSVKEQGGKWVTKLDPRVKFASIKSKLAWRSLLHPHKALEGVLFDVDLWHIWRNIHCPVLLIRGENSDLLTASIVEKMRDIHENTEVMVIPNTGHAPILFQRTQHEQIYQWLTKQQRAC